MTVNPKVDPEDVAEVYREVERHFVDRVPRLDDPRSNAEVIVNLVITGLVHRGLRHEAGRRGMRRIAATAAILVAATSLAACGEDDAACGSPKVVGILRHIIDDKGLSAAIESAAQEVGGKASYDIDDVTTLERTDNTARCNAAIAFTTTRKDGQVTTARSATFAYEVSRTDAGKIKVRAHGL